MVEIRVGDRMRNWVGDRVIGLIRVIVCFTFIPNIGNISRVFISNRVSDNLGATIGKIHTIFTTGSITITVFMLFKIGTRVVISNSITILVKSRGFISRFMVRISMVSRGMVNRCRVSNRSRVNRVDSMMNRGSFEDRGNTNSLLNRVNSMVNRGSLEDRSNADSLMNRVSSMEVILVMSIKVTMGTGMEVIMMEVVTVEVIAIEVILVEVIMVEIITEVTIEVIKSMTVEVTMSTSMEVITKVAMRMSIESMSRGVDREMAGSRVGGSNLLLICVLVNLIGGSSRLAVHNSVRVSTGFMDRSMYCRGISLLEDLMAVLIGNSQSQEG
jgi:hypothetical protein